MYSIIITTSPIPSNPYTMVIDEVIQSLNIPEDIEVFIVCDGFKEKNSDSKYKSGIINNIDAFNYKKYIDTLIKKYPKFKIIKKDKRQGFAQNVYETLLMCKNEFVLICQHDVKFNKQINFENLIYQYFKKSDMNYLGFDSLSTKHYKDRLNELKIDTIDNPYKDNNILPLIFWYDKNHLARKSFYINNVFTDTRVKNFIEDTFGHIQLYDVKKNGIERIYNFYKSYLLLRSDSNSTIEHINGRKFK